MDPKFAQLPFDRLNEADVREEVIAPLIKMLGYQSGTTNDVIREQSLRYPRLFLGRKDSNRDPELRGRADYILEVQQRLRWVIEAKPPTPELTRDDVEQAWTYANHPEVRAIYFVLCNGRFLVVYRAAESPTAAAVLCISYDQLAEKFRVLQNLLTPEALLRDFPQTTLDIGVPIAPGLRSIARITNGAIWYKQNSWGLTLLNELQTSIREGAVERDENGRLVAYLNAGGFTRSLQEFNDRMGLSKFEMVSNDTTLSLEADRPTTFQYQKVLTLPAGEEILDISTWKPVKLPTNVLCTVTTEAVGAYTDRSFCGTFVATFNYSMGGLHVPLKLSGGFEIHLV